jgi:Protein of unknown function (DUF3775)
MWLREIQTDWESAMRATITMPIETLALIIAKARAMPEDEAADDVEDDEDAREDEDDAELTTAEQEEAEDDDDQKEDDELTELLAELSDDELVQLLALVLIGSGEFDNESWDQAIGLARTVGEEDTLTRLLDADNLGDLIEGGLAELGYSVVVEQEGVPS